MTSLGHIDLPVTSYHHHDVESISEISIYQPASYANSTILPTITKSRSRPQLERKFTSSTYPEGGLKAWSVVLGAFSSMLASFGFMATIGVFQEHIGAHQLQGTSPSKVGWIFSIYVFLSFFGGLQVGPIFDVRGPTGLLIAGTVALVSGVLFMSFSSNYWQFLLSIGVLAGSGTSLLFTPSISSISHFFLAKRALATGLAVSGGALGGIIFPLMFQHLVPKVGFSWSCRVLALIDLILCCFGMLLTKTNKTYVKNVQLEGAKSARTIREYLPNFSILSKMSFLFTTLGVFFMEWGLFIPIAYLVSFITQKQVMSVTSASILVMILNTGSAFGRFMPGFFADKIGRFNCMILLLILCGLAAIGLWLPATLLHDPTTVKNMTISFALLFGFASGANVSLTPVCVGQLCSTGEYGRYYATCYTIVSFSTLTGIPIAGMLVKAFNGGYLGVVIFTGVCYLLGTACFMGARVKEVGWRIKNQGSGGYVIF